uniref:Uncharacterized protein n=1 Tax=Tanacetum cinerariifolium TaxID=118510 RepID=A0A6L2JSH3_TANCI|nr:hypothetical protein CTI12_AA059870 [Tanacetum cinerariifolium]
MCSHKFTNSYIQICFKVKNSILATDSVFSGTTAPFAAFVSSSSDFSCRLIIGTLGCVYAPQISKALSGTDKKELLKKLPTFIYDEEKALEVVGT